MSKAFVNRRNRSHDAWNPFQRTPSTRRKSLPRDAERERSPARPSYKSEFPVTDTLSPRSGSPSRPLSPSSFEKKSRQLLRHRDLKRKLVFDLHHEIQKPIHTTLLEEISDIDRITAICMSTLHSMMDNKVQRKYLHHMNNGNNSAAVTRSPLPDSVSWNVTNNSFIRAPDKVGKQTSSHKSVTVMPPDKKQEKEQKAKAQKQQQNTAAPKQYMMTALASKKAAQGYQQMKPMMDKYATDTHSPAKGKGAVVFDASPSAATLQATRSTHGVGPSGAGPSANTTASASVAQHRRHSSKIAAAERMLEAKDLEATLNERLSAGGAEPIDEKMLFMRTFNQLTPIEALNCAWLRLTKEQVAILEQRCRDEGIDPGIHAHSDVMEYDVFAEMREIRRKEKETTKGNNPNDITDKIRLYKRT